MTGRAAAAAAGAKAIIYRAVSELIPYVGNAKIHHAPQVDAIAASIKEFGFNNPILLDGDSGVIAGHGRLMAAKKLRLDEVPCVELGHLDDAQRRAYILADNRLAEIHTDWNLDIVRDELEALELEGFDIDLTGFDAGELLSEEPEGDDTVHEAGSLLAEFGIAPFSILDTKGGAWQKRKNWWKAQIGDEGESREGTLYQDGAAPFLKKLQSVSNGVSILDPVLSEVVVSWFGTKGGVVFDPFAGDSVFGFVSASCGMTFRGIELRAEQAELNQKRCTEAGLDATYYCDTSENMGAYIEDESADLIFSCPPYADLEVYSDDPKDLSTMSHDDFFEVYRRILTGTYAKLKPNRFAVIVMGEVRRKKGGGGYIGTIPRTIEIMEAAGYTFYNEIILATNVGTVAMTAGRQMRASRKIGKTHQNVLVFVKGDPKRAAEDLGDISMNMDTESDEEAEA